MTNSSFLREPKQDRSRASLERLLKAAAELLAERGYAEFTLLEVSKRAQVSIGSIYNRFSSKEYLLRQVQERELAIMADDSAKVVDAIASKHLPLRKLVPAVVREYANLLARYRNILRPIMEISVNDDVVAKSGQQFAIRHIAEFEKLLNSVADEIRQPDPQRAIKSAFHVIYAAISRTLGLGMLIDEDPHYDWEALIDDLSEMTLHYLLGTPDKLKR